ncbi:MAG: FAD-dependent oxidoreductase, partial [Bryobacteraceae bacterium]
MSTRVVVLGGGVGGLSAAQELAERGFEVVVYERRPDFGGKARSIPVPNSTTPGRNPLPGEHGFRFFPSFYKHLPDTMKRIPFAGK